MKRVKKLGEDSINKIAAGEVVSRPSSVMKELVENSLDAGARSVDMRVEEAGTALIEVVDDGTGMSPDDLLLSVERYTTSKISVPEDLYNIDTYGFRGEALASIASVSKMEIESVPLNGDEGSAVTVQGGKVISTREYRGRKGTAVRVIDLFYNTPARKKFLKSRKVEESDIRATFWNLAIPCNEVSFSLTLNGKRYSSLPAEGAGFERVFRREPDLAGETMVFEEISPYFMIRGLLTVPSRTFATAGKIHIFVNRRPVRDGMILAAIRNGMRGLIPENRLPAAYIFIQASPEDVDFNVHPAKREVRFRYRKELFELLKYAIRKVCMPGLPRSAEDSGMAHFSGNRVAGPVGTSNMIENDRGEFLKNGIHNGKPFYAAEVSGPEGDERVDGRISFSTMKLIGQVMGNYLLLDGGEILIFVDIHAASERINFWKLLEGKRHWLKHPDRLLITVDISEDKLGGFSREVEKTMNEIGYSASLSGGMLRISAVPVYLKKLDPLNVMGDIVELLSLDLGGSASGMERFMESLVARMACHESVRGTRRLPGEEIKALLSELDSAFYMDTCPHGRPVYLKVTREKLHRLFGRE